MEKEKQKRVEEDATSTTPIQSVETMQSISDESPLDKLIKALKKQSEEIKVIKELCYRSLVELEIINHTDDLFEEKEESIFDNDGRFKQPKLFTTLTQDLFVRKFENGNV